MSAVAMNRLSSPGELRQQALSTTKQVRILNIETIKGFSNLHLDWFHAIKQLDKQWFFGVFHRQRNTTYQESTLKNYWMTENQ
jgi:hypothetical protein